MIKTPSGNQSLSYGSDYFCVYNTSQFPTTGYLEILGFATNVKTNSNGCNMFSQKVYHTTVLTTGITGLANNIQCKYFVSVYSLGPANIFVFFNYPS